jgi:hypothetical protein
MVMWKIGMEQKTTFITIVSVDGACGQDLLQSFQRNIVFLMGFCDSYA